MWLWLVLQAARRCGAHTRHLSTPRAPFHRPIPERLTGSLVRCWAPRLHCGGITRHKHGATAAYLPPRPDVEVGAKAGAQPRPAASDTGSASGTKRQREASDSSEGESEDEDAAARQAARRAEELQWQLPPRDPVAPVAPPPKTMTLHSCGAKVVVDTSLGNPLAKGPAAAPVGKLRILDSGARGVGKGGAAPHTAVSVKQQRAVPVKAPKAVPVKAPKAAPVKAQKTVKAAASKPVNKPVEEPASTPVNAPSIAGQLCPSAAASGSGGSSQEAAAFAGQRAPLRASPPPAPILTGACLVTDCVSW